MIMLLVGSILFGLGKLCVRNHEFAPLSAYFSFRGRRSFNRALSEQEAEIHEPPHESEPEPKSTPEPEYEAKEEGFEAEESIDPSDPYAVLGCSPTDSDEKIKNAYRQLAQQYHPDKIAGKDLPKPFVEFAHQKFRAIQEAYEKIMSERERMGRTAKRG